MRERQKMNGGGQACQRRKGRKETIWTFVFFDILFKPAVVADISAQTNLPSEEPRGAHPSDSSRTSLGPWQRWYSGS